MTGPALLSVRNLAVEFHDHGGITRAVQGVSFSLHSGQTLAIVGESGSGKSTSAMAILRLLQPGSSRVLADHILFEGQDLLRLSDSTMDSMRGRRIAMIFQDPSSSLNPVYTVGDQLAETIRRHHGCSRRSAWRLGIEALHQVQIPDQHLRARDYPPQLSGGMQQRVMIAMALACQSVLLIADEPTSALDVTVQAQILMLLRDVQDQTGLAILLITHDFGVVAEMADGICVMQHGRVVEQGPAGQVLDHPQHPYTRFLLHSAMQLEGARHDGR